MGQLLFMGGRFGGWKVARLQGFEPDLGLICAGYGGGEIRLIELERRY